MTIEKRASPGPMMATDGIGVMCSEYYVSGTLRSSTKQIHSMLLKWSYTDVRIYKVFFWVLVFIHFNSTNIIRSVKIAINMLQKNGGSKSLSNYKNMW